MFYFFLTMITEIITSLRVTNVMQCAAIVVVLMLFGSPSSVGTILGVGTKLGILSHIRESKKS